MKQTIVLLIFGGALAYLLSSYASGAAANGQGNLTGARGGTSGCTCHTVTTGIGTTVELDSAGVLVTSYRGGGSYTVKISAANTTTTGLTDLSHFGFQLSMVKSTNAGSTSAAMAGTWGTLPPSTQITTTGSCNVVEQTQAITATTGTGGVGTTYVESIPWTAPAAGTGSVKIYGVVNAVNYDGSSRGDAYQVATAVTITETTVTAPVASVSIALTSGTNPTCAGSSVTFTATPTNGGTAPSYQWKVNGTNVGTNSATYTTTTLATGSVVTCVMTSNLSGVTGSPATSNSITMTINPTVVPSVSISTPNQTVCSGTSVTFTATPTNGGTPSYQWKVNGTNVGTNSATYTTTTLTTGAVVTCVMTSTATCASPTTATSNSITMTINPSVTPSVSITTPATTVCTGTSVTFTATPTNGGTPSYQWKVNGTNVGTNSATYTTTTLTNGAVVTCVMTSTASCASPTTATSNSITMTISGAVTPSVTISTPTTSICTSASTTFTATPTNGGTTPSYQWKVNGTNVGTNSATYTSTTLTNGAVVTCVMTSSSSCASPTTATSNSLTMTVSSSVAPSVSIATPNHTVCSGTSVTFTATPTNGGTTPSYQWKVNGTNVGTNSATYTTTTLTNGAVVTCVMTSTAPCASPTTATSASITMTVNPSVTPSVSVTTPATTVCSGSSVTFTATPTNGGTPSYQWQVNSTNVGTNSSTYTSTTLTNGAVVTCIMTSTAACASPATATSSPITMTISGAVTPSVTISTPTTTICPSTSTTFTATPTNGGAAPSYQWKVNGTNAGTNSPTFTSSTLTNGAIVTCVMTSNAPCASTTTATSNSLTMTVATQTPTITISLSTNSPCSGTPDTFSAVITNGGTNPSYQWQVNGADSGSNSNKYISSTLNNGAVVTCILTSSLACASPATATSNPITLSITPSVTPSLFLLATSLNICVGTADTFYAQGNFLGPNPTYFWELDGTPVGSDTSVFMSSSIINGGSITCIVTSDAACASPLMLNAGAIVYVSSFPTVSVLPAGPLTVCEGDSIQLTASGAATYNWTTGAQTASIWVSQPGSYSVVGTNVSCSAAPTTPVVVSVDSPAIPTITQSGNVLTSSSASGYQWLVNDTILYGDTAKSDWMGETGSYIVVTRNANGCYARSASYNFTYTAGIIGVSADLGVKLYPVPNQGSFMVESTNLSRAELVIYDIYGQKLYQQQLNGDHTQVSADLPAAIYFVTVSDGSRTETIKMQVTKE